MSNRTHRRPQGKQLFVEHIAERLDAMEAGRTVLKALAYRAHARMLREALDAFLPDKLEALLESPRAALRHAIYDRCFELTGELQEAAADAEAVRREAESLFARLR